MYVLDPDHISLIQRGGPEAQRILEKLTHFREDETCVTVITYEEQIKILDWGRGRRAEDRRERAEEGEAIAL